MTVTRPYASSANVTMRSNRARPAAPTAAEPLSRPRRGRRRRSATAVRPAVERRGHVGLADPGALLLGRRVLAVLRAGRRVGRLVAHDRPRPPSARSSRRPSASCRSSLGSEKMRSSSAVRTSSTSRKPALGEVFEHLLDEHLGHRRAAGDADGRDAVEPGLLDLVGVVDAVRGLRAVLEGDLDEPHAVRRVRRADDDHEIGILRDLLDRDLAVLRGVADVVRRRILQLREPLAQAPDGLHRLVDRQRRLRQPDDLRRVPHLDDVGMRRASSRS